MSFNCSSSGRFLFYLRLTFLLVNRINVLPNLASYFCCDVCVEHGVCSCPHVRETSELGPVLTKFSIVRERDD